jgi:hypothetical protein
MKKVGFLSFGIVLVIVIITLQQESIYAKMKNILHKAAHDIENGVVKSHRHLRSFDTELKEN